MTTTVSVTAFLGTGGRVWTPAFAETRMPSDLVFDPDSFTTLNTTITTGTGDHDVTYRFYRAIPYVARPIDRVYQSLNISVPIEIDGQPIDASIGPILFSNSVGGYMPSSVAEANGIDEGGMGGPMPGGMPSDQPPEGNLDEVPTGGNMMMNRGERVSIAKYALAAGMVVVEPGARGRTLVNAEGIYYGVAPAAIVDLKAAVRYIRHNAGRIPGNVDKIVSTGTSAGGALSALLGATGDNPEYTRYLSELGAAEASDAVFATGAWCPITDLEHADMAYEWNWGSNPFGEAGMVDQTLSVALRDAFVKYQDGLGLSATDGSGPLSSDTYGPYLVRNYLMPAATQYLLALKEPDRSAYLADHPQINWDGLTAEFSWDRFLSHVGSRKKSVPAFDALDLSSGENNLFGTGTTEARHFTTFGLRAASGDTSAELDDDLPALVNLMNPMPDIMRGNPSRARHWWLRVGSKDTDTSLSVVGNLAAAVLQAGDSVNTRFYWDAGHGSNEDPDAFIQWIKDIS